MGIDKENGLWYDELLSYSFAKESFPAGIIESVTKSEFQGIFHYLYLGLWMILFGESDISLRFSSLVFGVALIPVVFFLGKELYSKGAGLFAALMVSLNPLLIYYSQEVRPYSLLAFLGAASFLFLFRAEKKQDFLNYLILALCNVLILYTYTIGFVFVFLQAVVFFIYRKFLVKEPVKGFLPVQAVIWGLYSPYIFSVANNFSYYFSSTFIEPFFYSGFNQFSILITLQDWFTPMLFGIYQHDEVFYREIFLNAGSVGLVVFSFVLLIIAVFLSGLLNSLKIPGGRAYIILLPCLGFLFFEVLAAINGNFCLVTRHTLLVFPLVFFLCCLGLYMIPHRKLFFSAASVISLIYLLSFASENAVPKWERAGIKPVVKFLKEYNLQNTDIVVTPSHSEFVKKYLPGVKTLEFNYMQAVFLDKSKELLKKFVLDRELIYETTKNTAHARLKPYLQQKKPSQVLENYLLNHFSGLEKGRYFIVIRKTDYAMYDEAELRNLLQDSEKYKDAAMFRMFVSKIVNDTLNISEKNLKLIKEKEIEPIWRVYVFKKIGA